MHSIAFVEQWRLWKSLVLRGAGFPAHGCEKLAAPSLVRAAQELEARQSVCRLACKQAYRELSARYPDRDKTDPSQRKALKWLKKGKVPDDLENSFGEMEFVAELNQLKTSVAAADAEQHRQYELESIRLSQALADTAADPRFVEALLWQNPTAAKHVLPRIAAGAGSLPANQKARQSQRLIASYLQRYCLKNDTIGFFGPLLWAESSLEYGKSKCIPGQEFLAKRVVFFEDWCINELARVFSEEPEILVHLSPRRHPTIRIEDQAFVVGGTGEVSEIIEAVINACDGRTAFQIASDFVQEPTSGFESEDDVYEILEELSEARLLIWELEIPAVTGRALHALRDILSCIDTSGARKAIATLDELDVLRCNLADAVGNPSEFKAAFSALSAHFEAITSSDSSRGHGEMYSSRGLVFEDCQRSQDVCFGGEVVEKLAPPLECVLHSSRWFTTEGARRFLLLAESGYHKLAADSKSPVVPLLSLVHHLVPLRTDRSPESFVGTLVSDLRSRWEAVIGEPVGEQVDLASSEILDRIKEVFATPESRFVSGVYQSPDIMVAAETFEQVVSGDATFVLGEVHAALNTLIAPSFARWHRNPDALSQAFYDDVGPNFMEPAQGKSQVSLTMNISPSDRHPHLLLNAACSSRSQELRLSIADLVVQQIGEEIVVCHKDTGQQYELITVLDSQVVAGLFAEFSPFGNRKHTPRVTIDNLVISRERWTLEPSEFPKLPKTSGLEQFLTVRSWATDLGLPRLVFYKSREETKPVYLDFDSPISIEIFATIVRNSSHLVVSEMLPTPDQTWLCDAKGQTYTSELRLAIVDGRQQASVKAPLRPVEASGESDSHESGTSG